jgi:uncharacterized membrane protein YgdD (TMEM256/DUF423 family)
MDEMKSTEGAGRPSRLDQSAALQARSGSILLFRISAALCFLAVAFGAFGAHALRSTIEGHGMLEVWNKAVFYHFVHAIALFVLAFCGTLNRGAWFLLLAGIILFSGSLYIMALTPLGGLCFLAGWAWLIAAPK